MSTPQHNAYDHFPFETQWRTDDLIYLRTRDLDLEVVGERAIFKHKDTGQELFCMPASATMQDAISIVNLVNAAFQVGTRIGYGHRRSKLQNNWFPTIT